MKSFSCYQLIILFVTLFSLNHLAYAADIAAGKNLAAICLNCHGSDGNSKSPQTPSLAGQRSYYIESQIKAFQSGKRDNPLMQGMVKNLSEQNITDIAAYFNSLTPKSAGGDPLLVKKGQTRAAMCLGCHGSNAQGRGGIPRLAGQRADYLKTQLLSFKNRSRKGGPMNGISNSLSEQDINEITAYLSSL